nr:hypothetical protein [Tanacetum cinerariifolium]
MADVNVNAPAGEAPTMAPPIRTDDQILPHIRWVPIVKSNCYLNVEKSQSNPIYKIVVDILKHTNFFRVFTASSTIPSIYIQQLWDTRKHKFHPRPDSPLHSPNEEPVLGYLKFSAKGTKREVFRMPIPGSHIIADIQEASYYHEYLEKVSKHQRYLAHETRSDPDSPAPKPTKLARKPKSQPEPKSTLAKTQGKKRKPTTKMSNKPSIAIKTRRGLVTKKRKPISSLRFKDDSVDEDVPAKEPHVMLKRLICRGHWSEGQARLDPGAQDEGQAGSNPNEQAEDREHIDLDVADVTPQPPPEKMDEGFTATAYPKVQENLKLTVEEQLYETLVKSMNCDHSKELAKDLAEARPSRASGSLGASGSSQVPPPPPSPPSTNEKDLQMDKDMDPDEQARSLNDEDITSAHIPKASTLASNYLPPPEDSLLAQTECHKLLTNSVDDSILRHNVSKPLPLGGPPGQVTIQSNFFFNKDLKYLRYDSKGSRPAMSISKMKAAYYPKVGLEQMVPHQMWIDEECKYDIAAMYGISHWWFQRQRFYIDRHTSEGDRRAVKTHMRILSVVRIKVFSMYGYDYIKKIVLLYADLNEHVMAERDLKYLYLSDFEDMYSLNLQGHLNHLPPKDKKILTTAVNLWTRHLVIRHRVEDFHLEIESYQTQLNLTKPDGTLQQIDEALEYQVKEFRINRINPGLNTRFWTRKHVDRSKEFMFAIQKRLKTKRIFRNLESFVDGRVRDGDYRLLKRIE